MTDDSPRYDVPRILGELKELRRQSEPEPSSRPVLRRGGARGSRIVQLFGGLACLTTWALIRAALKMPRVPV